MGWICPQCGVDGIADTCHTHAIESGGCGFVRIPSGVKIRSEKNSKEISIRVDTTFGQASLTHLNPDEAKFLSSEQFRIRKSTELAGWVIENISWATNPVYLNEVPVPAGGQLLKNGDRVAVKGTKFPLTVTLIV